jgi:uncharacterized 2Fe-2S/4Fe-4S cluster protein (DUF4445 family)
MPKVTVIAGEALRAIPYSPGISVQQILENAGLLVRGGCRGDGACGLCLVRIVGGEVPLPTKNERLILPDEQFANHLRLACQLKPEGDILIRIVNPVSKLSWRDLAPECLPCTPSSLPPLAGLPVANHAYGLAIDLGTTQISLSLWDLTKGRRLRSRVGPNPQAYYGADVVTRLTAAGESPESARRLARLPLDAVAEALHDMCSREGAELQDVVHVAVVGNTAMLALLTESDSRQLLQPQNWTRSLDYRVEQPQSWLSTLEIHPHAKVEVLASVAGFVGSDLSAGVVATRLLDRPGSLLIDFGTNSEMALWDGHRLWVTSAAGGPAFESCGMQCAMPAEPGAIYRFEEAQNSAGFHFEVLGGGEAKGFCGSGLVDLIACLRDRGDLTRMGGFAGSQREEAEVVLQASPAIRLSKRDVDTFQRAKAAIGAGITALLAQAKLNAAELSRLCVCGLFGRNLGIRNAQRIGLLPEMPPERIELCGNTALAGCERLLLSPCGGAEVLALRERATIINLSQASDFDNLFLENLYLDPMPGDGGGERGRAQSRRGEIR